MYSHSESPIKHWVSSKSSWATLPTRNYPSFLFPYILPSLISCVVFCFVSLAASGLPHMLLNLPVYVMQSNLPLF